MSRQLVGLDAACRYETDERLKVALLGPADVARGKIPAALFVFAVVPSGPV